MCACKQYFVRWHHVVSWAKVEPNWTFCARWPAGSYGIDNWEVDLKFLQKFQYIFLLWNIFVITDADCNWHKFKLNFEKQSFKPTWGQYWIPKQYILSGVSYDVILLSIWRTRQSFLRGTDSLHLLFQQKCLGCLTPAAGMGRLSELSPDRASNQMICRYLTFLNSHLLLSFGSVKLARAESQKHKSTTTKPTIWQVTATSVRCKKSLF